MPERSTYPITQEMIDRYGRINGDNDIIHYDEAYARSRGFRGTLAHGLMIMAYAAETGARQHGEAWHRHGRLTITWTAPVHPGHTVTLTETAGHIEANVESGLVMTGELGVDE